MMSSFLTTKVRIPPQPHEATRRARLNNALECGSPHYKLVLVSAPAGYGKTTFLTQWARSSRFPVAWLSLGEADNDVERFLRYLLAAWAVVQPTVVESPLGTLLGARSPDSQAVLTAFINVANELSNHTTFVLDDYHLIEEPTIHEALTFLLDHLPPTLHFILAGRGAPPLPLARYRARGEILEFQALDLRFSTEETEEFLNDRMGLDLDPEEIASLHAQTEGWIAGLQLVALTLRQRLTGTEKVIVSGQHRFISDFLDEEVLAPLPDGVRRFLLRSSILERLCASLCEAVTEQADGQAMLETLEREELFLLPLDDQRTWFRYHGLFAAYLRQVLERRYPDEVAVLHQRAARWHLARNLPDAAFHHAVEGEEVDLILDVFERYTQEMLFSGEFNVLQEWLDALPEAWHLDYPLIGLVRTGVLLFTGQLDACVRCIEEVESRIVSAEEGDARPQLARVGAVRCSIACFQNDLARAEVLARQSFRNLPEDDHFFRAIIYGSLGDTYRRNARWEEAKRCYLSLLEHVDTAHRPVQSAHVFGALADLDLRQGNLRDAAGSWRQALAAMEKPASWGRLPLPLTGWVHIRLGELLYEWNELEEARAHLARGLERAELGGDTRAMIAGYLLAGRLRLTSGDAEGATAELERARPLVEDAHLPHWHSRFERLQLELWLAQDQLRAAVNWADAILQDETLTRHPESDVAELALARLLIVKGDGESVEQAVALLDSALQAAKESGRTGITIEALALRALAFAKRGDTGSAMSSLERALRLAEPEGYVRCFADLGLPMARLLQDARSRAVMPGYVERILAAFGSQDSLSTPSRRVLPEPLTTREKEVLALLAAGLTNREIAEELVLSAGTVKKHASNIYGKLAVGSRTEAAARARELNLLD